MNNSPTTRQKAQYLASIRLAFELMTEAQLAVFGERWELICQERGWAHPSRPAATAGNARRIEAVLKKAAELASEMPNEWRPDVHDEEDRLD